MSPHIKKIIRERAFGEDLAAILNDMDRIDDLKPPDAPRIEPTQKPKTS